jgi:hypothetical protein
MWQRRLEHSEESPVGSACAVVRRPHRPLSRPPHPEAQVEALEAGVDAELVTDRIAELKADKATYEAALAEIPVQQEDAEADQLAQRLARIPDLGQQLRDAPREIQRQTFEAFDLKIAFDKAAGRIEVSATVTEAVANAFENTKALQAEGFQVTFSDIAGAGFEPATFGL